MHEASHGLHSQVEGRLVRPFTILRVATDTCVYHALVEFLDTFIVQLQLLYRLGHEVLHENISLAHSQQVSNDLFAFRLLQIDSHAPLVPVDRHEVG